MFEGEFAFVLTTFDSYGREKNTQLRANDAEDYNQWTYVISLMIQ